MNKACDKIFETSNLVCSKMLLLQVICTTPSRHEEEKPVYFRIPHSFSYWMCKKQSAVSHSSAESEILSLDAGFTRKWFARASVLGLRNEE